MLVSSAAPAQVPTVPAAALRASSLDLSTLPDGDVAAALAAFLRSCEAISQGRPELRKGVPTPVVLQKLCATTLAAKPEGPAAARRFFQSSFDAYDIVPDLPLRPGGPAFFTGYYEPVVEGALDRTDEFREPLLSRPPDLVTLDPGDPRGSLPPDLSSARRTARGDLAPVPERAEIEAGVLGATAPPVAWVRDAVEAFLIHVQGSAAVRLPDGQLARLTYAGRNGWPYTSIGRILIETGEIAEGDMSLARLKEWVRAQGQGPGERGRALLQRNKSFVFFTRDTSGQRAEGPIGAASVPLAPLASMAVDRTIWPYGLPFLVQSSLPDPLGDRQRLMIAQDTGSAILGPARADLFVGTGDEAGRIAGEIRHTGRMVVLWPRAEPGP